MIDTDKYERILKATYPTDSIRCDTLLAHGLHLLAEVKQVNHFIKWVKDTHPHAYRDLKKAYERREDKL